MATRRSNHPSRNWRRRLRDAADTEAIRIAEKRTENINDRMLATLIAREAYILGYEAGRESRK